MNTDQIEPSSSELQAFVGAALQRVEKLDYSWFFGFEEPLRIVTEGPWRFIVPQRILVTDEDHGQQFGLPEPVNASELVMSRLGSSTVQSVRMGESTGDLIVDLGNGLCLQFLQMSGGYESWHAYTEQYEIICLGGGELASIRRGTEGNR